MLRTVKTGSVWPLPGKHNLQCLRIMAGLARWASIQLLLTSAVGKRSKRFEWSDGPDAVPGSMPRWFVATFLCRSTCWLHARKITGTSLCLLDVLLQSAVRVCRIAHEREFTSWVMLRLGPRGCLCIPEALANDNYCGYVTSLIYKSK